MAMAKYYKSDEGKVVDGAILVWIDSTRAAVPRPDPAATRASVSKAQAAALVAAAKAGVPVCQRCEPAAPARRENGPK